MKSHSMVLAAMVWAAVVCAADTSHHKAVYRDVQASLDSCTKVTAKAEGADGEVRITGWISPEGEVVKIVAEPGNAGRGTDEIFVEDGRPLFVFSTRPARAGKPAVEERLYFRDAEIIQWLSSEEEFVPHSEDYESLAQRMEADTEAFVDAIRAAAKGRGAKEQAGKVFEGVFEGIDQGDYAHWKMRDRRGREKSFFILETTPAIDRAVEDPGHYEGRVCRAVWTTRKENIPEAGGPMEIDVLLDISWP